MPIVSIAVPVYNAGKYLRQCLDSLINQTYHDIEILCVNDGSTDNSLEILNEYAAKDKRIKVFTKQNEGKGAASARNLGADNATGKYIQFLDSDDFFEHDMLEELVSEAEKEGADIIICGADKYNDKLQKITGKVTTIELDIVRKKTFNYRDYPDLIFQIGDLVAWNKLFRKSLIDKYELRFEEIKISDDQYLPALALVLAEKITVINRIFIHYRYDTSSSQTSNRAVYPQAAYMAVFSIVDALKKHGIYEEVEQSFINSALYTMRAYYDDVDTLEAFKFLHYAYKSELFPFFRIEDRTPEFYRCPNMYKWVRLVLDNTFDEVLYKTVRAYNAPFTTGILRFGELSDTEEVILADDIDSRYKCAKLILSGNLKHIKSEEDKTNESP